MYFFCKYEILHINMTYLQFLHSRWSIRIVFTYLPYEVKTCLPWCISPPCPENTYLAPLAIQHCSHVQHHWSHRRASSSGSHRHMLLPVRSCEEGMRGVVKPRFVCPWIHTAWLWSVLAWVSPKHMAF